MKKKGIRSILVCVVTRIEEIKSLLQDTTTKGMFAQVVAEAELIIVNICVINLDLWDLFGRLLNFSGSCSKSTLFVVVV